MQQAIPRVVFLFKDACQQQVFLREVIKLLAEQNIIAAVEESPCHRLQQCDLLISGCSVEKKKAYIARKRSENHLFFLIVESPVIISSLVAEISAWWRADIMARPLWGCVLIGGMSRRMGYPKHLIQLEDNTTWLERTVAKLLEHVEHVVIAGKGAVPPSLHHLIRLQDAVGVQGPLAGILSAMRHYPAHSWLVTACDMPLLASSGIAWLLEQRRAEYWGVVPMRADGTRQPLLAWYDFRSRSLFETLSDEKEFRMTEICASEKIISPVIPQILQSSWCNCNTPEAAEAAVGRKS